MRPGRAFLVGEQGPEVFSPQSAGVIRPNRDLPQLAQPAAMSAPIINVSVNASGAVSPDEVDRRVRTGIAEAAPLIIQATEKRNAQRSLARGR